MRIKLYAGLETTGELCYQCSVDTEAASIVNVRGYEMKLPYILVSTESSKMIKETLSNEGHVTLEGNYIVCYDSSWGARGHAPVEHDMVGNNIVGISSIEAADFGVILKGLFISDPIHTITELVSKKEPMTIG